MRASLAVLSSFFLCAAAMGDTNARCAALSASSAPDTKLTTAVLVPEREGLPAYCQVEGKIVGRVSWSSECLPPCWHGN